MKKAALYATVADLQNVVKIMKTKRDFKLRRGDYSLFLKDTVIEIEFEGNK